MSRISCDSTPCGSVYASILSSAASRTSPGESTSALVIARFSRPSCARCVAPSARAVADADDADRRESERLAFGEEAALDGREQRLGHRVAAARAADQDRIAVLDQSCRFVCRDLFHGSAQVVFDVRANDRSKLASADSPSASRGSCPTRRASCRRSVRRPRRVRSEFAQRRRRRRRRAMQRPSAQRTPSPGRLTMRFGPIASPATSCSAISDSIARRGDDSQSRSCSPTGQTAASPFSGSRMMPLANDDAAWFGRPGRTLIVGRRATRPSTKPLRV